jgi:hypothetical protein
METAKLKNAHYIKLGEKGKWAEECIQNNIARIGWDIVNIEDIQNEKWEDIKNQINDYYQKRGKKNGATQDYNALKKFCEATCEDIFITFYKGKMYWCKLNDSPVEKDETSKFRKTQSSWSCNPIGDNHKILYNNEISGEISKTQAFQATLCSFNKRETEIIDRTINNILNPNVERILKHKSNICDLTIELLRELHWKDCETLTDLIFLQSGWRRISMKGESMEYTDMEYYDPINHEKYAVQVKTGANLNDFEKYQGEFTGRGFRRLFFVVFNPDKSLFNFSNESSDIELLYGEKLSTLIFDLGLLEWVLNKSK